jgi:hypothetical protein
VSSGARHNVLGRIDKLTRPNSSGTHYARAAPRQNRNTGPDLRRLARRTQDAKHARRLLALATIYDGGSRSDAARIGDVVLQIIRDWVLRFNENGPDGLVDRKAPGRCPQFFQARSLCSLDLSVQVRRARGNRSEAYGFIHQTALDLLSEEFRASVRLQPLN